MSTRICRILAVAAMLVALTALFLSVVDADSLDPRDRQVAQLMGAADRAEWPVWKRAWTRHSTPAWFREGCETAVLPWPPVEVPGRGALYPWAGNTVLVEPFPLSEFSRVRPDQPRGMYAVGLETPLTMGFGLYCIFVSPSIDVRLTCERTEFRTAGCSPDAAVRTVELSPGSHWLLVHDRLGVASGFYTVETRCHDRTDTCSAGGLSGMYLHPPLSAHAFVPEDDPVGR